MRRTRTSTTPKATQDQRNQEKKEQEKPESDEDIKAKIKKVIEELRRKATESNEKEKDFVYPTDMSQEYKYYTEGGHIWRQSHARREKEWWDDDYVFEHEKGKGKDQYGKKGGQGKEKPKKEKQEQEKQPGFVPRNEEDRQHWDRIGKIQEQSADNLRDLPVPRQALPVEMEPGQFLLVLLRRLSEKVFEAVQGPQRRKSV